MRQTLHGFSELSKLKTSGTSVNSNQAKEMNMENLNNYFDATITYYNHTKRYGFAKVLITAGTVLNFDISTKEQQYSKDDDIDVDSLQEYKEGDTLENDIYVKAFVHASTVANAGHKAGLREGQHVPVKIELYEKGIQITKIHSVNTNSNEERLSNEFLTFVLAKVKMCDVNKFGFVSIEHHYETGEPLEKPVDAYFNWHILERAQYDTVSEGDYLLVKYYTFRNGKSSVTQIKYRDKASEEISKILGSLGESEAA